MKTIYKYPLDLTEQQTLKLPKGAELLSVGNQNRSLVIWAIVDNEEKQLEDVTLKIFGTGFDLSSLTLYSTFLGTVQQGASVWHVFYD